MLPFFVVNIVAEVVVVGEVSSDSSMSVSNLHSVDSDDSDREETSNKSEDRDKSLMEYWKAVQAKAGIAINLNAFSKEPKDPNRPPRLSAKLGSHLHDEVDHHLNTREELPVLWDWQHRIAQPKKSVKGPKLTAPVKGPEPLVPINDNSNNNNDIHMI
jgi:hypothetical protein